ncbi:variable surface protein [Plasmodium gonderi]|uniref:Variable surface protein n=1 Tax=Plasmodium gonderi TaxID=77519 RepID=A0A1Y1JNZ0_PLAGO|nr:variable surface protein [Plasmodium gonderi]GAW84189.1 variable surface protein [Plasmodium gonderi]
MSEDIILDLIKECDNCNDNVFQGDNELFKKLDSKLEDYDCNNTCQLHTVYNIPNNNDIKKFYLFLYNKILDIRHYDNNNCTCLNLWIKKKEIQYRNNSLTNNYMQLWNNLIKKLFQELHSTSADGCDDDYCCNWKPNIPESIFSSEITSGTIKVSTVFSSELSLKNSSFFHSPIKYILSVCITMLISTIFIFYLVYNSNRIKTFLYNKSILKFLIKKNFKKPNIYGNYEDFLLDSTNNRIMVPYMSNNNF